MKRNNLLMLLAMTVVGSVAFGSVRTEGCGPGYGPSETNLAVLLDDENDQKVLQIGYTTMGMFFEIEQQGCKKMTLREDRLLCDGQDIGQVGKVKMETEDDYYSGPRANVVLKPQNFDITGACSVKPEKLFVLHITK